MRKDLEVPMDEFNTMSKAEQIDALCSYHDCTPKKRKIHLNQYTNKGWNPHPPQKFVNWWGSVGAEKTEGKTNRGWQNVDAVVAFNCEAARETYLESKQIGAV